MKNSGWIPVQDSRYVYINSVIDADDNSGLHVLEASATMITSLIRLSILSPDQTLESVTTSMSVDLVRIHEFP